MRRSPLALPAVLLCVVVALSAPGAHARGTLDQSNTYGTNDGGQISNERPLLVFGQTFTAGISGLLDTVALDLLSEQSGNTATVGIYAVTAMGLPDPAALLASTTVTVTQTTFTENPSLYTVATFSSPAAVVAGRQYAIVLSNAQPENATIDWNGETPSEYPRGQLVDSPNGVSGPYFGDRTFSLDFQTFVSQPPTPMPTATSTSSVTISGQFLPSLTIATKGCGTTTPAGTIAAYIGQNVVVRAIPCPGSMFTGWTGGPCDGTRTNPCDIGVGAAMLVTAAFAP